MRSARQTDSVRNSLIRHIEHAFADVSRDDGCSWQEGDEIDNHGTDEELLAAKALDRDTCWQEVSPELFDQYPSAVAFLDAKGLRYYLPAFMIADIKRNGRWESAIDDGFEARLAEPDSRDEL